MTIFLVILALLFMIGGLFNLSNATMGVGAICAGAVFAIFARIEQASRQHREIMAVNVKRNDATSPPA